MNRELLSKLAVGLTSAAFAASVFGAVVPSDRDSAGATAAKPVSTADRDIPLVNWSAPQFFNPQVGISSNMPGLMASGVSPKLALDLATFIPIAPCRLVDTRGLFNPVYAGGPFDAGNDEVRVYRAPGNTCLIPADGRAKAVSLAVTMPPTGFSGDIEVVSESATLGGTVVMVYQAGQWNSATTLTAVDTQGDFKVQVRAAPGAGAAHVVIDMNGYYSSAPSTNNDYFSMVGTYTLGGGLLYVENASATGAAIHGLNDATGAQTLLAFGNSAVAIFEGNLRVFGAGIPLPGTASTKTAMVHKVNTSGPFGNGSGAGTVCAGFPQYSVINNVHANNNDDAILIVTPLEAYDAGGSGNTAIGNYPITASYVGTNCSTDSIGHWAIRRLDSTPHANAMGYSILIVVP